MATAAKPSEKKQELEELRKIKPHEERALRRVYAKLSNYAARSKLEREIEKAPNEAREAELMEQLAAVNAQKSKITTLDLSEMLRSLGRPSTKRYIWDMIWEADETISGSLDYDDIKVCFQRNISDRSGLEPSKLYNLVSFHSARTRVADI
mmetsp:Transcript_63269/g.142683  ORF Transcript_63269/g.142683 Transcript_63269/m.142683 type:complete len:151 (-) Transcript_63269:504-956(-)